MYSPNFNVTNPYELWKKQKPELYQPPLSAYSPEYPGPNNFGVNFPYSAGTHEKLNRLNQIKYYGYKNLRPIGVNKTMEQLDIESAVMDTDVAATVENELMDPSLQLEMDPDVDLDDEMPNLDSDEDLNLNEEDEGFMAEEVEYQYDHSVTTTVDNEEIHQHGRERILEENSIVGTASATNAASGTSAVSATSDTVNTGTSASTGTTVPSISTNLTSELESEFGKSDDDSDSEEDMILDDSS